jgi:hypothetical protein
MIHGILSKLNVGDMVQVYQLSDQDLNLDDTEGTHTVAAVPSEIQTLLHTYAYIFADNVQFPPTRSCVHSIPLVPEATPVHIKPYMYAPALKDEIEQQVQTMLAAGL